MTLKKGPGQTAPKSKGGSSAVGTYLQRAPPPPPPREGNDSYWCKFSGAEEREEERRGLVRP